MGIQCGKKKAFKTRNGAENALDAIWKGSYTDPSKRAKNRVRPCRVYRCRNCGMYHLTSKPKDSVSDTVKTA